MGEPKVKMHDKCDGQAKSAMGEPHRMHARCATGEPRRMGGMGGVGGMGGMVVWWYGGMVGQ